MALHTLGTAGTASLQCLPAWSAVLAAADMAAIGQSIVDDSAFASILSGYGFGATAVLATGNEHASTLLNNLAGVSGAPLAQIQIGDLVLGQNIVAPTYVVAIPSSTSVTLSQAALSIASGVKVAFVRPHPKGLTENAQLIVPKRGVLKILPGDVVAIDNTGWPVLVSGASIGYSDSLWSFA